MEFELYRFDGNKMISVDSEFYVNWEIPTFAMWIKIPWIWVYENDVEYYIKHDTKTRGVSYDQPFLHNTGIQIWKSIVKTKIVHEHEVEYLFVRC